MKLDKLALIVIAVIGATVAACDETAMIDDIVINGLTEEAGEPILFADLKQTEGETTVAPTHLNREGILDLIANFPNQDSTDEEKKQWNKAVIAASVNVNVLEISGCMPEPPVLEVGPGESIEIKKIQMKSHAPY